MLSFVQNWLAQRANPIGVDFGSDCLRLAQVQWVGGDHKLIAAASADVPSHVRHDPQARFAFFIETTRDLLAQGNFRGRQTVLALPASSMHIQHIRMAKMDEAQTRKALAWEARGKMPIDPSQALMRHMVAGEIYHDQEPKNEVIVMAAAREFVNQLLASASKARLDVIGMNVEPKAVVDCFSHVYRRKADAETTNCFLDIGLTASRAMIARGGNILFARTIPVGGSHFNEATAHALRISADEAKLLRIQLAISQPPAEERRQKSEVPLAEAAPAEQPVVVDPMAERNAAVQQACMGPLSRLTEELDLCRRYYESTFTQNPVDRLVFVGGEARQRGLCQHIARELGLAAQLGDPLVRMGRVSEVGIESGIDRRQPQPGWAVAIGLSMGPAQNEEQTAVAGKASADVRV
ncbi:MAG TPA: pilus assembly protein PilM [Tepidisphaeraceae bacterium]|nr:pilus assembly protein PilM [Tepidisphaeraceae bacterium]